MEKYYINGIIKKKLKWRDLHLEDLKKKLFSDKETGWSKIDENMQKTIFQFCNSYIDFLNIGKTEREVMHYAEKLVRENGFKSIDEMESLKAGDRVYYLNREKSMYLAVIGSDSIENGINIIGSHADSPRLDLKPNPLYEDSGFAYLKTHYYGGIKKYQWTAIPLAIHGVILKKDGEKLEISIGEDDIDPIFTISDLLPHLAQEQMKKKLAEGVNAEDLTLLVGSVPYDKEGSDQIKLNILNILNKKYGIVEDDFMSSELEIVPAFKAKSLGFDESMIAGYGQDDRICVYTSLKALLEIDTPKRTAVCLLSDKEEIGSVGNTGMESHVFDTYISEILNKLGVNRPNLLDKVFCNSKMLSADVDAGYDPLYASVSDKTNAAFLGSGMGVNKYTGARGKSGASDANAEFVYEIRKLFEDNKIQFHMAELGKVDIGGGGTIAFILANKGIDVIDCGVPVLSMHAPYEVTSKYDVYEAYRGYKAFFNN